MNRSRDLEGVHGPIKRMDLERVEPGCSIVQISGEQLSSATADEDAIGVHGAFPLSMGMGREDRGQM